VINEDWLEELVSHTMRKEIGAVGAKLLYPNGSIQHAGVILYENHPGIHIYQKRKENDPGYFNKLNLVQNYSAVTAACLAVKKELFELVGGLDEQNLSIAYNDVDFCLKLREKGFYNLWTPFSMLYHHESLSRGDDFDERNIERFKKEHAYILRKWKKFISNDSYFNPNLSPETQVTALAYPPKVLFSWRKKDSYSDQHLSHINKYDSVT
jgi:GT2 family glycosyltransferase